MTTINIPSGLCTNINNRWVLKKISATGVPGNANIQYKSSNATTYNNISVPYNQDVYQTLSGVSNTISLDIDVNINNNIPIITLEIDYVDYCDSQYACGRANRTTVEIKNSTINYTTLNSNSFYSIGMDYRNGINNRGTIAALNTDKYQYHGFICENNVIKLAYYKTVLDYVNNTVISDTLETILPPTQPLWTVTWFNNVPSTNSITSFHYGRNTWITNGNQSPVPANINLNQTNQALQVQIKDAIIAGIANKQGVALNDSNLVDFANGMTVTVSGFSNRTCVITHKPNAFINTGGIRLNCSVFDNKYEVSFTSATKQTTIPTVNLSISTFVIPQLEYTGTCGTVYIPQKNFDYRYLNSLFITEDLNTANSAPNPAIAVPDTLAKWDSYSPNLYRYQWATVYTTSLTNIKSCPIKKISFTNNWTSSINTFQVRKNNILQPSANDIDYTSSDVFDITLNVTTTNGTCNFTKTYNNII